MIEATQSPRLFAHQAAQERWLLPLILSLFVGSGAAALIYEIVWFQLLQLVIGSSAVSLGVLLGTFMGGMCLGSLLLPRLASARHHPLRVYSVIELGLGVIGILVLLLMPLVGGLYTAWGGYGLTGFLLRGVVAAMCLLPPTMLMGATLPAVARWVETTPAGVAWLGFFYSGNVLGAVFGSLLAGFYLLRVYDVAHATYVAASINGAVAAIGFTLASWTRYGVPDETNGAPAPRGNVVGAADSPSFAGPHRRTSANPPEPSAEAGAFDEGDRWPPTWNAPAGSDHATELSETGSGMSGQGSGSRPDPRPPIPALWSRTTWRSVPGNVTVYVAIALSGLCALAAEVIWTRTLGLLFGASVYTFSIILAVFLVGLGIGSGVGSLLAKSIGRPGVALGWCQMLVAAAIAWAAYMLAESLPYWPITPSMSTSIWFTFQLDIARASWTLLPGALLWGASFPLALAAVATKGQDAGRLVGSVYAANTLGAIIGALSAGLLLVPWVGSQRAQQTLIAFSGMAGLLMLMPAARSLRTSGLRSTGAVPLLSGVGLGWFLIWSVPPTSELLVAYGRNAASRVGESQILYMGEGVNSSVAVSLLPSGVMSYHNAGKVQASGEPQDMRLQRMLGHLTTLVPATPRSVVVIGCGAGVTAGAVAIDPRVERVTIVEIEPLVPQVISDYFSVYNHDVIRSPKVQVIVDDARHYILTTDETFDALTSDPLDPWVKGAAALYTKEFLEAVKQRLNPGGVVTLFVQLYESTAEAVKSEVATFFEVFPNGAIWGNMHEGKGYDMVLVGQVEPLRIDIDEVQRRLSGRGYAQVVYSLREIDFGSAVDLFATYAGRGSDLKEWLRDAAINRDRNLRLQYLAGLGLNLYTSATIYSDMLAHRRFPEDLFAGDPAQLHVLRERIQRAGN